MSQKKNPMEGFNASKLIEEVKKRPGLYRTDLPVDKEEKLMLWKDVGASMYNDWDTFNKATAYDRVLHLQRKWRSLRDAYMRELRARRTHRRINRRVYVYYKSMKFLGGCEEGMSDGEDGVDGNSVNETHSMDDDYDPLEDDVEVKPKMKLKKKRKKVKREALPAELQLDEVEAEPNEALPAKEEMDSEKLFLLSFLPEMRQLPLNAKMWARAQIAHIMQEAVASHFPIPGGSAADRTSVVDVKMQAQDRLNGYP